MYLYVGLYIYYIIHIWIIYITYITYIILQYKYILFKRIHFYNHVLSSDHIKFYDIGYKFCPIINGPCFTSHHMRYGRVSCLV